MNKRKDKEIKRNKEIIWISWRVMSSHRKSMMNKSCWDLTNIVCSSLQLIGSNKEREVFTYRYTILDIFYECEHSLKYDMLKSWHWTRKTMWWVMFSYIWDKLYCLGSSNMLSLPFSLMPAKFIAPSRDTTCASKYP